MLFLPRVTMWKTSLCLLYSEWPQCAALLGPLCTELGALLIVVSSPAEIKDYMASGRAACLLVGPSAHLVNHATRTILDFEHSDQSRTMVPLVRLLHPDARLSGVADATAVRLDGLLDSITLGRAIQAAECSLADATSHVRPRLSESLPCGAETAGPAAPRPSSEAQHHSTRREIDMTKHAHVALNTLFEPRCSTIGAVSAELVARWT